MPNASQITATDFVVVPTQDFERSKAFYRDTLGLEEGAAWGDLPGQEFETGNLTIAVMDPTGFGQQFKPSAGSIVMRVENFETAKSDLESKGVTFVTDTIDSGVCHLAYFLDPDGNSLGIPGRVSRWCPSLHPSAKPNNAAPLGRLLQGS